MLLLVYEEKKPQVSHIEFLKCLKNLILGLFWAHFGPKTSKQYFSEKGCKDQL